MFAVESKTVRVRFQEGNDKKTYAIQWTELLTTSENPFESLSEIIPGTEVLAPYYMTRETRSIILLQLLQERDKRKVSVFDYMP